ncbi:MAG TPA: alpha/beta hydrolase [Ideonella sp.]|uniref:alpha/beta hydrolase n=1 Tax=Ideonella sp. TaxID=1929293 RepID=UPI002E325C15|nr:lysophospholipase [Ideonella sp.]HEX5686081.1 alpha/beta hydrolase [Ideonella sp.]
MHALVQTQDGLALHVRRWSPTSPARGQVLIVHGLGEHGGRYAHVATDLLTRGWDVTAFDQRGHGHSAGAPGDIACADSLLADLARVIDAVRARLPGPLVLLGHSLGGLVAARFVAESLATQPAGWSRPLDALVLSSPALDPGMNAVQRALLAVVPKVLPHLRVNNGLKPEWVSRDPAVVKAYVDDPLVHDRISGLLAQFIAGAGPVVQDAAARWTLPTLLMWAGADRCVRPEGSARFAAAVPPAVVATREWPGFSHEIFNEPEKDRVLAELNRWLDQRFAPH